VSFGDTIKTLRKQREMTQRELADALGVNFTYISKIESGKIEVLPSEELIRNIARVLDTNAEQLLDLAGKLDLKQLQQVAMDKPEVGAILRRIQSGNLTDQQLKDLKTALGNRDENA
jgi:HTH-type transcriptional regulator, competence development regulator